MPKMQGVEAHKRRLRKMRTGLVRPVTQALLVGAKEIADDAALSITTGATSGKAHVPSAPGEPPNADTHVLSNNIEGVAVGPLKAEASSNAPYGAAQEFGSEKLGLPERPYMRPAAAKERPHTTKRVVDAVNKVIAASG